MKNTFGSISYHLSIRQSTIRKFCTDFYIDFERQILKRTSLDKDIQFKQNFIEFLKENYTFLLNFEIDYYSDKTPETIAELTSKKIDRVNFYLQKKFPQLYENRVFTPKGKYILRYESSYKIDMNLGGDYSKLINSIQKHAL